MPAEKKEIARQERERLRLQEQQKREALERLRTEENAKSSDGEVSRWLTAPRAAVSRAAARRCGRRRRFDAVGRRGARGEDARIGGGGAALLLRTPCAASLTAAAGAHQHKTAGAAAPAAGRWQLSTRLTAAQPTALPPPTFTTPGRARAEPPRVPAEAGGDLPALCAHDDRQGQEAVSGWPARHPAAVAATACSRRTCRLSVVSLVSNRRCPPHPAPTQTPNRPNPQEQGQARPPRA